MTRKPVVRDRSMALWGGLALFVAGGFLLYDAYENRGVDRPFAMKFLPF